MPDHRHAPLIAVVLGAVVMALSDSIVAGIGVALLLMLGHISDQLNYLIHQRDRDRV